MYQSIDSSLLTDEANGKENHIGLTVEFLIEFLDNAKQYQAQVKNTFVLIDFKNGDCMHYWKHLTNGMFAQMKSTATFPDLYEQPYNQ